MNLRMAMWAMLFMAGSAQALAPVALPQGGSTQPSWPAFDANKAAQLHTKRRAALERELFAEIGYWNSTSRSYPTQADLAKREQRWQAMAQEGLELAHITLQVLRPSSGQVLAPMEPLRQLDKLAQRGHTGAMCLLEPLSMEASSRYTVGEYALRGEDWMERGAELGHPACQAALGGRLLMLSGGAANKARKGWPLMAAAAKAGHLENVGMLVFHLETQGLQTPQAVKRLYCWLSVEPQTEPGVAIDMTKLIMGGQAPGSPQAHAKQLETLERWQPQAKDCVALGLGLDG